MHSFLKIAAVIFLFGVQLSIRVSKILRRLMCRDSSCPYHIYSACGTGDRTRTCTLKANGPKPFASTNSATPVMLF